MRKIDQIDLVHGQNDVTNTKCSGNEGMASCLGQYTLTGIDEHDSKIGCRGTSRHVARILRMTGCISDNEFATWCRKEAIGDINGDALLPLSLQTVNQQCEIEIVIRGTELAAVVLQRCELVLEDQFRVIEQASDER